MIIYYMTKIQVKSLTKRMFQTSFTNYQKRLETKQIVNASDGVAYIIVENTNLFINCPENLVFRICESYITAYLL